MIPPSTNLDVNVFKARLETKPNMRLVNGSIWSDRVEMGSENIFLIINLNKFKNKYKYNHLEKVK